MTTGSVVSGIVAARPTTNLHIKTRSSDGKEERLGFMRNMVETGCYRNVRLINLSSEVVTAGWDHEVGLLWIDGDHRYDAVRRDWECWRRHLAPGATVAFDDSTDPRLGPKQLIEELAAAGDLSDARLVGKVTFARFRT